MTKQKSTAPPNECKTTHVYLKSFIRPYFYLRLRQVEHFDHRWIEHTYHGAVFCDHCGTMLHGLTKQGLQCEGASHTQGLLSPCRIPFHPSTVFTSSTSITETSRRFYNSWPTSKSLKTCSIFLRFFFFRKDCT